MTKKKEQSPALKSLPETGFIRLSQVLQVFPVSISGWYAGVSEGLYPRPVKLGKRIAAWKVQDIRALIERLGNAEGE
jgi:predicted DNA-binding transcriptional regulator AlpA